MSVDASKSSKDLVLCSGTEHRDSFQFSGSWRPPSGEVASDADERVRGGRAIGENDLDAVAILDFDQAILLRMRQLHKDFSSCAHFLKYTRVECSRQYYRESIIT